MLEASPVSCLLKAIVHLYAFPSVHPLSYISANSLSASKTALPLPSTTLVPQNHLHPRPNSKSRQPSLAEPEPTPNIPPLPSVSLAIPTHVQVPTHAPSRAHHRRSNREPQSRNQQCADGRGLVLGEIGVGTLRAVELVGGVVGAAGGRVGCWVVDFGGFAEFASVDAVVGVQEEGAGCCEDYVAGEES